MTLRSIRTVPRATRSPRSNLAILRTIRSHGGCRGCVADMAAYYGEYPELAVPRMAWARAVAEGLRHHAAVSHLRRPEPRAHLVLAA